MNSPEIKVGQWYKEGDLPKYYKVLKIKDSYLIEIYDTCGGQRLVNKAAFEVDIASGWLTECEVPVNETLISVNSNDAIE